MKYILILSLLFCNTIIGQVHDYNIRIDYPKDPDSVYVLLTGNSGAFAGWGRFNSLPQLATLLQEFLTTASISNGDKGDITVSGSGSTWNVNTNAIGSAELASSTIFPGTYPWNTQYQIDEDGRITGAATVSDIFSGYATTADVALKLNISDTSAMLDPYPLDINVVHKTGDETISGVKSFSDKIKINGGSTGGNTGSENLYKMQIKMGHPPGYGFTVSNGTIDPWFHINSNGIGFVGNNDTIPFWSIESDVNLTKELRAHIVPGADYSYLWAKGGDVSNRNVLQLWGNDDIYLQAGRSNSATDLSGSIWLQGTEGTHFVDWGVISNASATVIDQVGGARLYQFTSGQVLKNLFQASGNNFITGGNFGVGNSSPAQALDVTGNGLFSGTLSASNLSGTNTGDQDLSGYLTSEVDGSTSNELQTITNSSDATSHTVTLSNSGGSVQLIEGSGVTLTTGGTGSAGTVTIAASGGGGGAAYDEYVAIVNQSGTSDPTATVLESLAAGTVVLDRSSNGVYTLVLSSAFTSGKTFISATIGANAEPINFIRMSWIDSSTIQMETQASGSYSDSDDGYFYISIRVYP